MNCLPLVSIVVLTHDAIEYTKICIESIRDAKTTIPYELIIVDNNSNNETKEYINKIDAIKCFNTVNIGVAGGRNLGFSLSSDSAEFICSLDNDTVVPDYWLDDFVNYMRSNPKVGIMGSSSNVRILKAKGFNKDLRTEWFNFCKKNNNLSPKEQLKLFYPMGFMCFSMQERNNHSKIFELKMPPDYIPGWCQFFRKKAILNLLSAMDTKFPAYSASDIDLSWNIGKNGFKAIYNENIFIHHFKGQSSIAKNPDRLVQDAYAGYARLSQKWKVEIIDYLSSNPTKRNKKNPYMSGSMIQQLVDFFGFFVQINNKWEIDINKINKTLFG
jgi:GT2 family glycosyltransferase